MDHSGQGGLLVKAVVKPAVPPPSADQQLVFLAKLQRLFAEGDFTATYKFALLTALADLAVEHGRDDGASLTLSIRKIAERFISLYWRHTSPYGSGRYGASPAVLSQNLGEQAAVLSAIGGFRKTTGISSFVQAKTHQDFAGLVTGVAATVSAQPLKYLHNFGGGTDQFLYERNERGLVRMLPGVAYCLRRFYPLIQQLTRTEWIAHIKGNQRNHSILGDVDDLEDFLFSTSRQSLEAMGSALRKLDGDRCFYCDGKLGAADVDHFVPFSLYRRDIAHNFVLAHPACNRSKSDALAAYAHLDRWLSRLDAQGSDIAQIGYDVGIPSAPDVICHVGRWAYEGAVGASAKAWRAPRVFEAVDLTYLSLFDESPAVVRKDAFHMKNSEIPEESPSWQQHFQG